MVDGFGRRVARVAGAASTSPLSSMCPRMNLRAPKSKSLKRKSQRQTRASVAGEVCRKEKLRPPNLEWVAQVSPLRPGFSSQVGLGRNTRKTFPRQNIHTEISPLRFASVEMTKGIVGPFTQLWLRDRGKDRPLMGLRPVLSFSGVSARPITTTLLSVPEHPLNTRPGISRVTPLFVGVA